MSDEGPGGALTCPSCATPAPAGARFCAACGARLVAEPAPQEMRKQVTVVFSRPRRLHRPRRAPRPGGAPPRPDALLRGLRGGADPPRRRGREVHRRRGDVRLRHPDRARGRRPARLPGRPSTWWPPSPRSTSISRPSSGRTSGSTACPLKIRPGDWVGRHGFQIDGTPAATRRLLLRDRRALAGRTRHRALRSRRDPGEPVFRARTTISLTVR